MLRGVPSSGRPLSRSATQISSPSAGDLANTSATFQLNTAPYSRWRSNGYYMIPESGQLNVTRGDVVAVVCQTTGTYYPALAVPLFNITPQTQVYIKPDIGWSGLSGATNRIYSIGYGRTLSAAMTGATSSTDGRLVFTRTRTGTAERHQAIFRISFGADVNTQTISYTSNGVELVNDGSAESTGAVTVGDGDCYVYIGLQSATANEVLNLYNCEVLRVSS